MQNATFASRRLAESVADHVAPAFAPPPVAEPSPKVGDKVRLKRPWHVLYRGAYRHYTVGRVVEVLGDGTLFALKFSSYPNTVDMGRSLLDLPGEPQ